MNFKQMHDLRLQTDSSYRDRINSFRRLREEVKFLKQNIELRLTDTHFSINLIQKRRFQEPVIIPIALYPVEVPTGSSFISG